MRLSVELSRDRVLRALLAVTIILLSIPAIAETVTFPLRNSFSLPCWTPSFNLCPIGREISYFGTGGNAYGSAEHTCQYQDQLPPGARVISARITAPMSRLSSGGGVPTVTFSIGSAIVEQRAVTTAPAECDSPSTVFQSQTFNDGWPGYVNGGPNTVKLRIDGAYGIEMRDYEAQIEITYVPPPPAFEITSSTPENQRRVLISKYGPEIYPSTYQSRANADRKMQMITIVRDFNRQPIPNKPVYFRLIDPPEDSYMYNDAVRNSSPYVPVATKIPGDNADPSGAFLSASVAGSGGATLQTVTDFAGRAIIYLTSTGHAAGDNYQVQASLEPELITDPSYVCGAQCSTSGVITAWKRVYVESDRMFRQGTYLREDVPPCPVAPCFLPLANLRGLRRNDRLRMIHAPRLTIEGPQQFYTEDVTIVAVDRRADRVEVTPYQQSYDGPQPLENGQPDLPYLADAVGVVTGVEADDYFSANTQHMRDIFEGSFVEYVMVYDDPAPYVPFKEEVTGGGEAPAQEVRAIARKWFLHVGRPNHQHLLTARRALNPKLLGLTTSRVGTNWCWIFVQSVEDSSPNRREWAFNGEVTVHELVHQWQVNTLATGGHCAERRWNSIPAWCTMHGSYDDFGNCHGTCPEFYDGVVGLHFTSQLASEYVQIRKRTDPMPQY